MNQRKTDFLNYLKHLSVTTLVHQQNFINKWYDLFSMLDENQYNSTEEEINKYFRYLTIAFKNS